MQNGDVYILTQFDPPAEPFEGIFHIDEDGTKYFTSASSREIGNGRYDVRPPGGAFPGIPQIWDYKGLSWVQHTHAIKLNDKLEEEH